MHPTRAARFACLALVLSAEGAIAANIVSAPQGGVARWAGLAAKECGIHGKRYAAVDAVCYYPVDIQTTPVFRNGAPRELFQLPRTFLVQGANPGALGDATRDLQRFLLAVPSEESARQEITVVLNWDEELRDDSRSGN